MTKKSLEGKKYWLAIVKLGRELYNDIQIEPDEFDTNNALRQRIGLQRTKNNNNEETRINTESKKKTKKKSKKKRKKIKKKTG